jgi:tRNA threonylcarbamoyladenosine biosynthesis protein TsaE
MTSSLQDTHKPPEWSAAWQRECLSAKATQTLARAIGAQATQGSVIGLIGAMGAGKTTFVQGLAQGWGVEHLADVTSPTYTLVNIYPSKRGPLAHLDLYRLTDVDSAIGLGLEETLADPSGLVVVEWADHLAELMPPHTVWLRLSRMTSVKHRLLEGVGLDAPPKRPRFG